MALCSLEGCLQAQECSAFAASFSETVNLSQKKQLSSSQHPKLREADGKPAKGAPTVFR